MKPFLFFDYDGTLHETMHIYRPAVQEVVQDLNARGYGIDMPSDRRIAGWLGMNTADMWRDFLPSLPENEKRPSAMQVGRGMLARLMRGEARWYPGTEAVLEQLKTAGYEMAVISNCGVSYARAHWEAFHMERWFTAFFECETYGGIPKAEILKKIVRNVPAALALAPVKRENASGEAAEDIGAHSPAHEAEQGAVRHLGQGRCIMIGDRESDLEAARAAEGRFIGCRYGYGTAEELSGSDVCISCISDLPEAVKCLEMRP